MKTGIITICLCAFFFILPLNCYIMGNDLGVGIQGAVYRYQITNQGNLLLPITKELDYVVSGIYEGKTAFSILFWVFGTIILSLITILTLVYTNYLTLRHIQIIVLGLMGLSVSYLISCFFQYGIFLSGPAGVSLPIGVIIVLMVALGIYYFKDMLTTTVK